MPDDTVWRLEPHTAAKHRILRAYLDAWIPIMGQARGVPPRLVLIDAFAGPGVYVDGEPGSPIIMLQAFLEHRLRPNIASELIFFFIEQDVQRFAELQRQIEALGEMPANVHVELRNDTYERAFGAVLDDIESRGTQLAPTFAFIDPFGYAEAPMQLSGRFLQFARCEVLLYVPLPWMNRFLSAPNHAAALTSFFGGEEWRQALDEPQGPQRIRFLHDLFRQQLETVGGLKYIRSFEIVTAGGATGYHLFYGTNSEVGLAKMKYAMWKVDPLGGERFRDSTDPNALVLFEPEVDTTPLKQMLRAHFGTAAFTIEQAMRYTLTLTPFAEEHVKTRTLKLLEAAGDIEPVEPPLARRKGTYPAGTRIRFTR
jgi:three-Cys-motif partner protein